MMPDEDHIHYDDEMVIKLEFAFGAKGFLSPGGPEEVAAIIDGIDVAGKDILDIGAGVGGPACLLVEEHGAAHVVGIDIEGPVLKHANNLAKEKGLLGRVKFMQVEPGPLPFEAARFDIVFSKDSIIHVPDKLSLFQEAYRVLKSGGWLVMSDWCCSDGPMSDEMSQWIDVTGLSFAMSPLGESKKLLSKAGFVEVTIQDRNAWFINFSSSMVEKLSGNDYGKMVEYFGEEGADIWLDRAKMRALVASQGQLRPGHLRGQKPR